MLEFDAVSKTHPGARAPALDRVSLRVPPGATCAILGSSGSGKSTLLRLANRLLDPDAGAIRVAGRAHNTIPLRELRQAIGYVFQRGALFPHLTVAGNVAAGPETAGWPARRVRARVRETLEAVALDPAAFAARYPRELSGGEYQRVAVARALATDPALLLMDEPFSALDGVTREKLQALVLDMKARLRKTILFVTHDLFEALLLGDTVAVLHAGRLEQTGPPAELRARPATPFVRNLFEAPLRLLNRT